jgi:flagellar motor switch protein FliN/FliY
MQAPENANTMNKLGTALSNAVSSILSDVCEQKWMATVSDQPASQTPEPIEAAYFKFTFSGCLEGEAYLALRRSELSALQFKAPAVEGASSQEPARILLSAIQNSVDIIGKDLSQYGSVVMQVDAIAEPNLPKEHVVEFLIQTGEPRSVLSCFVFISPRLVAAAQAISARAFAYPSAAPSANLDLVLDVELNVTLRFGQRQLSLREVLDLTSGSVVELDRQVDEPVELVLDGRVVARGEAVIIDGNYGMRITQVLQPLVA